MQAECIKLLIKSSVCTLGPSSQMLIYHDISDIDFSVSHGCYAKGFPLVDALWGGDSKEFGLLERRFNLQVDLEGPRHHGLIEFRLLHEA
jgi:hypothetical protein